MIQLHTDCLVFETSDGEAIPCSAQDVTVELLGDAAHELEPMLVTEAADEVGRRARWLRHRGRVVVVVVVVVVLALFDAPPAL